MVNGDLSDINDSKNGVFELPYRLKEHGDREK